MRYSRLLRTEREGWGDWARAVVCWITGHLTASDLGGYRYCKRCHDTVPS
jgi:hypothetical protein